MYPRFSSFDYVLRYMRDTVTLAAQREPGFNGIVVMNDRKAGKVVGITLWESEAEMLTSAEGEYLQEQTSRIIGHLRRPPGFENYEIEVL
jgi:heme-degrading monooxygenase HmoA